MKQLFQSLADGTTAVKDVPAPQVIEGHVLIRTQASIVSAGTERMLVDFGKANLFAKARQQPDRSKRSSTRSAPTVWPRRSMRSAASSAGQSPSATPMPASCSQ